MSIQQLHKFFSSFFLALIVFFGGCGQGCGGGSQQKIPDESPSTTSSDTSSDSANQYNNATTSPPPGDNCTQGCTYNTQNGTFTVQGSSRTVVTDDKKTKTTRLSF